jgi:hypothetical protein
MEPGSLWQADGYRVIDLSDPQNPKISAPTVHSMQWTNIVALGPDYFVLGKSPQNLGVYPIPWSNGVRLVDTFPASPYMNALQTSGNYLYWTGTGFGVSGDRSVTQDLFEVVDIAFAPFRVVATLDRPLDENGWAIQLIGHYAYVGTDSELIVYDITAPTSPVQTLVINSPAISFAVQGNYLYAGSYSGNNGLLLIYDVSTPGNPRRVASLPLPDYPYGIAAQAGWVAVAMGKSGVNIYSAANPAQPVFADSYMGTFWGIAGSGNLLYAAMDSSGLVIFDVSQPKLPYPISETTLAIGDETYGGYFPNALSVSLDPRGIAWLCTPKDGRVYGLDVRSAVQPRHIAEFPTEIGAAQCQTAAVANGLLIVAGNDAAFDTSVSQNVGLYEVPQAQPGQILPDRYNDLPPVATAKVSAAEPLKARALHRRPGAAGTRTLRRRKPH